MGYTPTGLSYPHAGKAIFPHPLSCENCRRIFQQGCFEALLRRVHVSTLTSLT